MLTFIVIYVLVLLFIWGREWKDNIFNAGYISSIILGVLSAIVELSVFSVDRFDERNILSYSDLKINKESNINIIEFNKDSNYVLISEIDTVMISDKNRYVMDCRKCNEAEKTREFLILSPGFFENITYSDTLYITKEKYDMIKE